MKQTLLEMTQEILTSMDGEEVNSINDTSEAGSVSVLIRRCYYDLINTLKPHEHYRLFELEATSSSTPSLMTLPTDIGFLEFVKYNKATTDDPDINFEEIEFKELKEFLDWMYSLTESDTEVDSFTYTDTGDSINFMCYNERMPSMYTTYNDNLIIFDAYDSDEETNLQKTKTLCHGRELPTFTMSDSFTPDLDAQQFPILVNKAKLLCFAELRQTDHKLAEREERRHLRTAQKDKRAITKQRELDRAPNYGRK